MNMIGWFYLALLVLVLGDYTLATAQHHDIQKIDENNNVANDITRLGDYIFGAEPGIQGRTFAQKRLQFMMLPMMFKMGVITTILIFLTVISLKGLTIGVILLVLKLSALFGKFYTIVQPQHQTPWLSSAQPVHLHVHGDGGGVGHYNHPYSAWESNYPPDTEPYYYKG